MQQIECSLCVGLPRGAIEPKVLHLKWTSAMFTAFNLTVVKHILDTMKHTSCLEGYRDEQDIVPILQEFTITLSKPSCTSRAGMLYEGGNE